MQVGAILNVDIERIKISEILAYGATWMYF